MRNLIAAAVVAAASFSAANASAAVESHFLQVVALGPGYGDKQAGPPPDLTPVAEALYQVGAMTDPASIENAGKIDATTGKFSLNHKAQQVSGTTVRPKEWQSVLRLQEE